jgi:hypothetical protein
MSGVSVPTTILPATKVPPQMAGTATSRPQSAARAPARLTTRDPAR